MTFTRRQVMRGGMALGAMAALPQMAHAGGTVNFFNWSDYTGEENLASFKKKTGITANETYFGSNTEVFAKLRSKKSGVDVAVPSQATLARMIEGGLLEELDLNKIPNFKNLAPEWQGLSFDKQNKYHIPYLWGTTGIGYNSAETGNTDMNDYKWVLESDKFSGQIAWLDDSGTMVEAASSYLSGSLPTKYDPALLKEAFKLLEKQKKHIKTFAPDTGQDLLMSGDVNIAMEYNGDIGQIANEDENMKYALPLNGANRWVDSMVIAKNAPNMDGAHKLINHMLDAEEGKELAEYVEYATPNAAAKALASAEYRNDPIRFPPADVVAKLPVAVYLGEEYEAAVDKGWTRLKSL